MQIPDGDDAGAARPPAAMGNGPQLAEQVALYGEPLAARFARVRAAFGIAQGRLAAVIGLSAPMLSQLASGQRAKISNPAVYARLLRLEELAGSAAGLDQAGQDAALAEVAASAPQLSTRLGADPAATADLLAVLADVATLERAAGAVPGTALADVLRAAAHRVR